MKIHEFYYNDRSLYVIFSLKKDKDDFYRVLELELEEILNYYPSIITEQDLYDIDDNFIIDLLTEYFKENDYPEQQSL
jgi:hypothetical protein